MVNYVLRRLLVAIPMLLGAMSIVFFAMRILPSSHTNPMFVLVDGQPVRASRQSAEWCLRAVDQCWSQKASKIAERERPAAEAAYEHARHVYRRILAETSAP